MGTVISADALSTLCNRPATAPKLLFHTKFTGMSVDAGHSEATQMDWHQDFVGSVDSVTGSDIVNDLKTLWGSSTNVDIFSIPQAAVADSATFATYFSSNVASDNLSLEINSAFGLYPSYPGEPGTYTIVPQTMLNITRSVTQATASDMGELCIITKFRLPSVFDLTGNPFAGKYCTLFEWKEGGYLNQAGIGAMRLEVMINRGLSGDAYNQWYVKLDNRANGIGVIPGLITEKVFYSRRSGIEAQLDVDTNLIVYWNRPAGRLFIAVQVNGGALQILADVYPADLDILSPELNGQLYGVYGYPICRLEPCMFYKTATYPSSVKFYEMQVWNRIPISIS